MTWSLELPHLSAAELLRLLKSDIWPDTGSKQQALPDNFLMSLHSGPFSPQDMVGKLNEGQKETRKKTH